MLPVSAEERLKKITELLSWYNRPLFFCSSTQSLVYKFYCSQFNFVLKNPVQSDENFFSYQHHVQVRELLLFCSHV